MKSIIPLPLFLAAFAILLVPCVAEASAPPIKIPAGAEIVSQYGYGPTESWIIKFPDQSAEALVTRNRYSARLTSFRRFARTLQREYKAQGVNLKVTVRRNEYIVSGGSAEETIFAKGKLSRNGRLFTVGVVTGPRGESATASLIQAVRGL